jgi:Fic family protein
MHKALDALERFVNLDTNAWPALVWLAMIHYQFEAIHPFRDGNGRIGRLLITLLLCTKDVLDKPLLYLSAYFERHRQEYYERLLEVSTRGRWVEWIVFFLRGIARQSRDAFRRTKALLDLQQDYQRAVGMAKRSGTQLRLVDLLIERPVVTVALVSARLEITYNAARNNMRRLIEAGILKEVGGRRRNRIYIAERVLDVINKPLSDV